MAAAIYERLVAAHPENIDYRIGQARCLRNQGTVVAAAGQPEQAESIYRKALTQLDPKDAKAQTLEGTRLQAGVLNNLGDLHLAGAEDAFRRSIALSTSLVARKPPANKDLHNLAIAQNNLAQLLVELKRLPEAGPLFAQSVANFEKLVTEAPKAIDFQSHFGIVLGLQGKWLDQSGKPDEGKFALESAIDHQRQAVQLSKNGPSIRELLGGHLIELAAIDLKLGLYEQAARIALDVPKTVPSSNRAQGCFDAAQILARLVTRVGGDGKLAQAERDRLTRNYLGRTIVLLREVIDTNPKLAEQIKTDPDIKVLESRPEFQTMMNTLVNIGQ